MHHHHDTTSVKRDTNRLMNQCTGVNMNGWIFTQSACRRDVNLQTVRVWCRPPHDLIEAHVDQFCNENEICVDTHMQVPHHGGLVHFAHAWCRSIESYSKIAGRLAGKTFGKIQIPADKRWRGRRVVTAEAIMAGNDMTTSLQSQSITIQAFHQQFTYSPSVPLLRELLNGKVSCENCSSVDLRPVPPATDVLQANVVLKAATSGTLFLTTIS